MGLDTIVAWSGALLVILLLIYSILDIHNNYLSQDIGLLQTIREEGSKLRTDFDVINISYNSSSQLLEVYLKNTGSEIIYFQDYSISRAKCFDVFIDDSWISKDKMKFILLNDSFDALLWNPDEYLKLNISIALSSGKHTIAIVLCNGVKEMETFVA